MTRQATGRNSNVEALRILAMLMIVMHHYAVHGVGLDRAGDSPGLLLDAVFMSFGKWGVDVFVLIAGFFALGHGPKKGYLAHMVHLWIQMLSVSLLVFVVHVLVDPTALTVGELVRAATPLSHNTWWFATNFMVLLAISPALDVFLTVSSQKFRLSAIVVMLVIWGFWQYVVSGVGAFSDFVLFIELYVIGDFIHRDVPIGTARRWGVVALTLAGLVALSSVVVQALSVWIPGVAQDHWQLLLASDSSPLTVFAAAAALCAARARRIWVSRSTNWLASMVFGVYLLHDHPWVRTTMWPRVPEIHAAESSWWFPLHMLAVVCTVFLGALVIEIVLSWCVQGPALRALRPFTSRLDATLPDLATRMAEGTQRALRKIGG